jgi:hypothetical protein
MQQNHFRILSATPQVYFAKRRRLVTRPILGELERYICG